MEHKKYVLIGLCIAFFSLANGMEENRSNSQIFPNKFANNRIIEVSYTLPVTKKLIPGQRGKSAVRVKVAPKVEENSFIKKFSRVPFSRAHSTRFRKKLQAVNTAATKKAVAEKALSRANSTRDLSKKIQKKGNRTVQKVSQMNPYAITTLSLIELPEVSDDSTSSSTSSDFNDRLWDNLMSDGEQGTTKSPRKTITENKEQELDN